MPDPEELPEKMAVEWNSERKHGRAIAERNHAKKSAIWLQQEPYLPSRKQSSNWIVRCLFYHF